MGKRILVSLSMLLIAGTMVACGSDEQISSAERDTLEVVIGSLAISMDPSASNDSSSAVINTQIYDTLLNQHYDTMEVYAALATSWEMVDAQTINIGLRQGVYFHNGMPLTARDVQVSLERAAASPNMEAVFGMLSHVDVHDDYNLTIHLEIPFVPMLRHLAHIGGGIVPADLVESGHDFNEHPIGTGPFQFANLDIDTRLDLVRNDNYWGNPVHVRELALRRVPDASIRLVEVQTGHADIALDPAVSDVAVAQADPSVVLMSVPNLSTNYIGINSSRYPFDNPLVRQAINYAIDTELLFSAALFGVGSPAVGFMAPNTWGFAEGMQMFPRNLERARELMIEAGYPDGFSAEIWYNTENAARRDISEITQNMLRDINIELSVVGLDWPTYLSRTSYGEHDMFVIGWVSLGGDADYGLFPPFHSSMHGAAGNRTFFSHPEVDRLLEAARGEMNEEVRRQMYIDAQQIIRDYSPWIPINHSANLAVASPAVRGFTLNPGGHHQFVRTYFGN